MIRNLIKIFTVFLVVFLLTGCESDPGVKLPKRKLESVGAIEDASFQKFWNDFRTAVLADDVEALRAFTEFKLEVKGGIDGPVILYSEDEFPAVFHAYLEQMSGPKGKEIEKEIELIERSKEPYIYRHDFAKVGGMEFAKINGDWKLTTVHLTKESMDEVSDTLNNPKHQ